MRRPFCCLLILTANLLLSSCSDKEARRYAQVLADMLASYSQQIDAKLADEEARYVNEAKRDEEAFERDQATELSTERGDNAEEAFKKLVEGKIKAPAVLETLMPAYAKKDFNQNQDLYEKAQEAYAAHLKGVTHLSLEKAKINALRQALQGLARAPDLAARLQEVSQLGSDLKTQINVGTCSSAVSTISARQAEITRLEAAIADPAQASSKEANQQRLSIAQADKKAAGTLRDATGRFKDSKCQ